MAMSYENIIVETRGRVGLIRLNRPQALNALNSALIAAATGRTRPRLRMSAHSKWCREQTSDADTLFQAQ